MEFKTDLDTYKFIMEFETYIMESQPVPFSKKKVIVDKDIIYNYLDNLRSKLPKEMKVCQRVFEEKQRNLEELEKERDQIIKSAEEEKKRIIVAAQEEAQRVFEEKQKAIEEAEKERDQIIKSAEEEKKRIIVAAQEEAQRVFNEEQQSVEEFEKKQSRKIVWPDLEGKPIISDATQGPQSIKDQKLFLVKEPREYKDTEKEFETMIAEAEKKAALIINEANAYVDNLLAKAHKTVEHTLSEVVNGRSEIRDVLIKLKKK